ncbi:MAG: hypothetical protein OCC45_12905 [Desulfotalea sp.]
MRSLVITVLISFFVTCSVFASDELDILLDDYYVAADLSSKTKNEALGTLFLYTANDLDKMLATRLSDVINSVPLFTTNYNNLGQSLLNLNGATPNESLSLRLFIDNQEVSNPVSGDAMAMWADLSLDFVSHIEVYLLNASFDLDTTPSLMMVRIYSKAPERQRGGVVSQSVTSDGGYASTAYYANTSGKNYFSLFASATKSSLGDAEFNGKDLSSKRENKIFLGSYSYNKKFDMQLGYMSQDAEPFIGFSLDGHPDSGGLEYKQAYVSARLRLLEDESLLVQVGYNKLFENDINEVNAEGIFSAFALNMPARYLNSYNSEADYDRFNLGVTKTFETDNSKLVASVGYERNSFDINTKISDIPFQNFPLVPVNYTPYNQYDKYIFILENSYSFTDNYLLSTSVRYDFVDPNKDTDSFGDLSYKVGFIANPVEPLMLKILYTHTCTTQNPYIVANSSEDLDSSEVDAFSAEINFQQENTNYRFLSGYAIADNFYKYDDKWQNYVNSEDVDFKYSYIILAVEHDFTNQISLSGDISKSFLDPSGGAAPDFKISIRGSYSYEKWMFYVHASYMPDYTYTPAVPGDPRVDVADAYNLNLGVRYKFNDSLSLDIKAYNILGEAGETPYFVGPSSPVGGDYLTDTVSVYPTMVEAKLRWSF